MSVKDRTSKALALLIPTGVIGISSALAAVQVRAEPVHADLKSSTTSIAERLSEIRSAISTVNNPVIDSASGAKLVLADWLNFGGGLGWHNGGWRNWGNGWGNGGWHNWGNGWHNWHNGWHNWHNFWHNW